MAELEPPPDLERHRPALLAWLRSGQVRPATRAVLQARLDERFGRKFFGAEQFARLTALAVVLVPHDPARLDLSGAVDDRLARGAGDGWRYADAPPDPEALTALLNALPPDFPRVDPEAQFQAVTALQRAFPHPFEDLLAELTGLYVSHPLAQLDLGCLGFADAPGWTHLGLDDPDPREEAAP